MKRNTLFNFITAGLCLAALAGTAQAEEAALNLGLPVTSGMNAYNSRVTNTRPNLLALNESGIAKDRVELQVTPSAEFEPPLFTGSKAHQYLGLGTVLFVGLTALSAPDEECERNCRDDRVAVSLG